ncbi:hypothetical protein [uncultured Fusobacterium sp.]|uniref:hypothetical protein n=1 Tax=uncultured Fusobacterium sp. TaxID=159267 RepID=UPI0025D0B068|nr:hypothetical protein [uncultured Fusobacterium sp.]
MKKIYNLEQEIKKIIEKNITIETNTTEGSPKTPEVFIGPIPTERIEEIVPAIGIVASSGANTLESKEIDIKVSILLYIDNTEEIYQKLYQMIDIVIEKILESGIYLDEFEACTNTKWEIDSNSLYMAGEISFKFIRTKTYRTDVDAWIKGEWE